MLIRNCYNEINLLLFQRVVDQRYIHFYFKFEHIMTAIFYQNKHILLSAVVKVKTASNNYCAHRQTNGIVTLWTTREDIKLVRELASCPGERSWVQIPNVPNQ